MPEATLRQLVNAQACEALQRPSGRGARWSELPGQCRVQRTRRTEQGVGGASPNQPSVAVKREFRQGFCPDRPADWIEQIPDGRGDVVAEIRGCLVALARGQRNFSYPRHDEQVDALLQQLVPGRRRAEFDLVTCPIDDRARRIGSLRRSDRSLGRREVGGKPPSAGSSRRIPGAVVSGRARRGHLQHA